MMLYNRRKRNEWHEVQMEKYYQKLAEAREAERLGTPTEEHLAILKKERTILAAEEAAKNKKGLWRRTKDFMLSGLKQEEDPEAVTSVLSGETLGEGTAQQEDQGGSGILKAVEDARKEKAAVEEAIASQSGVESPREGVLDQVGDENTGVRSGGRISDWLKGWGSGSGSGNSS